MAQKTIDFENDILGPIGSLKGDLSRLSEDLDNISGQPDYDVTWTVGGYISSSNGEVVESSSWKYTDFIELKDPKLIVTFSGSINPYNAMYDANKKFLRNLEIRNGVNPNLPSDTKYIRLSCGTPTVFEIDYPRISVIDINEKAEQNTADITQNASNISQNASNLDFLNGHPLEYSMTWIDSGYIDGSNGDLIPYNGWHYTDYIELENNDALYVSTSKGVDNEYNAFYDSNKAFIRNLYISGNSDHKIISYVPQNAKYVRLSCESEYSINLYPITTVADLAERVTTLETEKSQPLPSYYADYMVEKNALVNTKMDLISNCLAFVFFTDSHIGSNKLRSPKMIDSILKNTSIKDVICGGDVISAYGDHNRIVKDCEIYKESYGFAKPYYVRGNHDNYAKATEDATTGIIEPNSMVINRFIRPYHDDIIIENGKTYYYFDRPLNKVRFICIDTTEIINETTGTSGEFQPSYSITQGQLDWFVNTLKNTPDGYKIVLLSHIPINSNLAWSGGEALIFGDIVEAFNNKTSINKTDNYAHVVNSDFYGTNGKVLLNICGHGHVDDSFVSDSGCVYYEVNCDTFLNNGGSVYERKVNSITEQSFDVVIINADNGDIHTVRYGAGIDRTLILH